MSRRKLDKDTEKFGVTDEREHKGENKAEARRLARLSSGLSGPMSHFQKYIPDGMRGFGCLDDAGAVKKCLDMGYTFAEDESGDRVYSASEVASDRLVLLLIPENVYNDDKKYEREVFEERMGMKGGRPKLAGVHNITVSDFTQSREVVFKKDKS